MYLVEYCIVDFYIYIKKLLFNLFFFVFVKLASINSYKPPKYRWNQMWFSLFIHLFFYNFIFTQSDDVFIVARSEQHV